MLCRGPLPQSLLPRPSPSPRPREVPTKPTPETKRATTEILDSETAKCDRDEAVPYDIPIFDRYPSPSVNDIGEVLKALCYRYGVQHLLLKVFLMLVDCGLLKLDAVKDFTTLREGSHNTWKVILRLATF